MPRRIARPMMSTRDDRSNMPDGRDHAAQRREHRLGQVAQHDVRGRRSACRGRTGNHDNSTRSEHDEPVDGEQRAENLAHVTRRSVQAACLQPLLLLLGDLDVRRREQEHLVGGLRHRAAERVREAAREVDEPALQVAVDALQVQDDGLAGLQPVADLLGVVEALRAPSRARVSRASGSASPPTTAAAVASGRSASSRSRRLRMTVTGLGSLVAARAQSRAAHDRGRSARSARDRRRTRRRSTRRRRRSTRRRRRGPSQTIVLRNTDMLASLRQPSSTLDGPRPLLTAPIVADRTRARGRRTEAPRCPTRTIVAPSPIAASKSPAHPHRAARAVRGRRPARAAPRSAGGDRRSAGGTVMSPSTRHAGVAADVDERRGRVRVAPALLRLASHVDLHEHRARRARGARSRRRARSRSTECHSATYGARRRTLLRCSRPMKCQRGAGVRRRERRRPWPRAPGRGSRRGRV